MTVAGGAVDTIGERAWLRVFLAGASGVLYFAAFPPLALGGVAFVALAPLVVAGRGASRSRAAFLGWLAGTIACTALVAPSVEAAALRYFELPRALATVSGVVAAQLYGAIYFALFGLAAREVTARRPPGVAAALGVAAAWVACDFARSTIGDGVPWILLAHSQTARPWLLQIADLTGAAGPSFVVALVNSTLAEVLASRDRARALVRIGGVTALVVAAVALYGQDRLARWQAPRDGAVRVALVQGALPDSWRSSLAFLPQSLARMHDLTRTVLGERPDLVVWPENAVSISVAANPASFAALEEGVPPHTRLLIGAPRAVSIATGRAEIRNAAVLVAPGGQIGGVYEKRTLTPWAETAPWPVALGRLLRPRRSGDYAPGAPSPLLEVNGHRFGVLICSEGLYSSLARAQVREGAEFIVNIANDGWFGGQAARDQHLAAVVVRAVETRRPVLRATTSGVTAAIDRRGVIVARAPVDGPATLVSEVSPSVGLTPYVRCGDVFAWLCVLGAAAAMWPARSFRRLRARTTA